MEKDSRNKSPQRPFIRCGIDINVKYSAYWRWNKGKYRYRNSIPYAIVKAFEDNGFIWGGKWYHYDTMHFEYRPELLHMKSASKRHL